MKTKWPLLISCLLALAACAKREPSPAPPVVRVAAASDLTVAFEELGRRFQQTSGLTVAFSFGSSGLLAKQIRERAPFDVFASANTSFVEAAVQAGACDGRTVAPYARGRIVLWTRRDAGTPPEALGALTEARFRHIAIANPEHAPYGKAARQALEKLGLWSQLEPRIVYGENIKQTLQYAQSGSVEAAVVALSLAIGTPDGAYVPIDGALHAPIDQALVVCKHGMNEEGGRAFASFVNGSEGRAVMRRNGLLLPGEELSASR